MAKEKREKRKGGGVMKKGEMIQRIMAFFNEDGARSYNYKQVSHAIEANKEPQKRQVFSILEDLTVDNLLIQISPGKFKLNARGTNAEGVFERRSNGKNRVRTTDGEVLFVAERNAMHAMNGDKVKILVYAKRRNRDPEAEVVEITEKANQTYIGILEVEKQYAFLLTDGKTLANDIFIPRNNLKGGKTGQKAIVHIVDWPERAKNPIGEVIEILGNAGENNTEIHAILAEYGLPYTYPAVAEAAANRINVTIDPEEISRREDFRGVTTFTIDPKDAKDFDDALSMRTLSNGNVEIGVHIADVTHYVTPGSIIDKEAEQRATSVYLVDRVVPMLPEKLCNEICSLRPNEEKLCFSAIFELNAKADVINSRICRTVIHSDRRFTYEEAQQIIETREGDFCQEIMEMDKLAKLLRKKRFEAGAINFDRHEVKFHIDETGKPLDVYFKVAQDANKLVEEFMLLANRTVAEFIGKRSKPKSFVYRVHDVPDPEKLRTMANFIARFGHKFKVDGTKSEVSRSINSLLDAVQGKREENLVETIAIRTMAKAVYTTQNIGHYGLAFEFYTHFTSPIRRYPDMLVHRLLQRYLDGGRSAIDTKLAELTKHCSEREQLAAGAERTSIKYKQVEFMSERLGEEFDGVISGVAEWGVYVEINENKCEGLVPIRDLEDDYYEYDEKQYCLIGRRCRKTYTLGDPIRIKVARANLERRQLDFTPA